MLNYVEHGDNFTFTLPCFWVILCFCDQSAVGILHICGLQQTKWQYWAREAQSVIMILTHSDSHRRCTRQFCCWFHYTEDLFVIWPHGSERIKDFLNYGITISLHHGDLNGHLPVQDCNNYRRPYSFGHIYTESWQSLTCVWLRSYTTIWWTSGICYPPCQMAKAIISQKSLNAELVTLQRTFHEKFKAPDKSTGFMTHPSRKSNHLERTPCPWSSSAWLQLWCTLCVREHKMAF
jgi:hypothetical protein